MRGAIIGLLVCFALGFLLLVSASALAQDRMVVLSLSIGMLFTLATAWGVWQIIRRFEPPVDAVASPAELAEAEARGEDEAGARS